MGIKSNVIIPIDTAAQQISPGKRDQITSRGNTLENQLHNPVVFFINIEVFYA
jgi:hypothetical protein